MIHKHIHKDPYCDPDKFKDEVERQQFLLKYHEKYSANPESLMAKLVAKYGPEPEHSEDEDEMKTVPGWGIRLGRLHQVRRVTARPQPVHR